MSRRTLIVVALGVLLLQAALWRATTPRNLVAERLQRNCVSAEARVERAEARMLDGRSRYAVTYAYVANGKEFRSEEFFSLRQGNLPQQGDRCSCYYDRSDPQLSTLTHPGLMMQRVRTLRTLCLGFGFFTLTFVGMIWRSSQLESEARATLSAQSPASE